jgi:serine protease Do
MDKNIKKFLLLTFFCSIIFSVFLSGITGFYAGKLWSGLPEAFSNGLNIFNRQNRSDRGAEDLAVAEQSLRAALDSEAAVVAVGEKVSPAVVSIIVTKDLPKIEQYYSAPQSGDPFEQFFGGDPFSNFFQFQAPQYRQNGTEKQEVGGGTGFIVSKDGYIVTNKHVVVDEKAEYTVVMNDESKHTAKVLARDTVNDIAILKIEGDNYPVVTLGDSAQVKPGQTAIAIGNALGEFTNTLSRGVISGLSRSITAGGQGMDSEDLVGVIQTDASINPGNSGGPLLNLKGEVIGINTAIVQGAQNIGFAIPINEAKSIIESVRRDGRIVRPWLGVRYVMIDETIAKENNLSVDYGALIVRGEKQTDLAVVPGGPADKAGLMENDIILEVNGKKIAKESNLVKEVNSYKPGDVITLKVLHRGETKEVKLTLEERKQ